MLRSVAMGTTIIFSCNNEYLTKPKEPTGNEDRRGLPIGSHITRHHPNLQPFRHMREPKTSDAQEMALSRANRSYDRQDTTSLWQWECRSGQ